MAVFSVPHYTQEAETLEIYKARIESRYRDIYPLSDDPKRGLTFNEMMKLFPDASPYGLHAANIFIERLRHSDPHSSFEEIVRSAVTKADDVELLSLPRSMKADLLTFLTIPPEKGAGQDLAIQQRMKLEEVLRPDFYSPELVKEDVKIAQAIGDKVKSNEALRHGLEVFDTLPPEQQKQVIAQYAYTVAEAYHIPPHEMYFVKSAVELTKNGTSSVVAIASRNETNGNNTIVFREDGINFANVLVLVPHEVEHNAQNYMARNALLNDETFSNPGMVQARLFAASYQPFNKKRNDPQTYIPQDINEKAYKLDSGEMHSYKSSKLIAYSVLDALGNDALKKKILDGYPDITREKEFFESAAVSADTELTVRENMHHFLKVFGEEDINGIQLRYVTQSYQKDVAQYQEMLEAAKHGTKGIKAFLAEKGELDAYPSHPEKRFEQLLRKTTKNIEENWENGANPADGRNLVEEAEFRLQDIGNLPSPEQVLRPADRKKPPSKT